MRPHLGSFPTNGPRRGGRAWRRRALGRFTALALLLGASSALYARPQARALQPSPGVSSAPTFISLARALDEARRKNPTLRAMTQRVAAARRRAAARFRRRFGRLDAVASYSFLDSDQMLAPISKDFLAGGLGGLPFDRHQFHYGLRLEVPLYLGGELQARINLGELAAERTSLSRAKQVWRVRFAVVAFYRAAQSLEEIKKALGRQIAALTSALSRVDQLVERGKRPPVDRLEVVESLRQAQAQVAKVEAQRVQTIAQLAAALGRDPAVALRVAPLPTSVPQLRSSERDLSRALPHTKTVAAAELRLKEAGQTIKLAWSQLLPRASASAYVMQHYGPDVGSPLTNWGLGLNLKLPLLSAWSGLTDVSAARHQRRAARLMLEQTKLTVSAGFRGAWATFQAGRKRLASARARIKAAREAARIQRLRYGAGAGTVDELLRAEARQAEAHAALARTRADLLVAGERLNMIVEKEVVR